MGKLAVGHRSQPFLKYKRFNAVFLRCWSFLPPASELHYNNGTYSYAAWLTGTHYAGSGICGEPLLFVQSPRDIKLSTHVYHCSLGCIPTDGSTRANVFMDRRDFWVRMTRLPSGWRGKCIDVIFTCHCLGQVRTRTGPAERVRARSVQGPPVRTNMNRCSVQCPEFLRKNLTEPNFGNNPCFLSISTSRTHIIWLSAIWSSSFLPSQQPISSHEQWGTHSQYAIDVFYLLNFLYYFQIPIVHRACFITQERLSSHFFKFCCPSTHVLDAVVFHAPADQTSNSHYADIGSTHVPWVNSILYPSYNHCNTSSHILFLGIFSSLFRPYHPHPSHTSRTVPGTIYPSSDLNLSMLSMIYIHSNNLNPPVLISDILLLLLSSAFLLPTVTHRGWCYTPPDMNGYSGQP